MDSASVLTAFALLSSFSSPSSRPSASSPGTPIVLRSSTPPGTSPSACAGVFPRYLNSSTSTLLRNRTRRDKTEDLSSAVTGKLCTVVFVLKARTQRPFTSIVSQHVFSMRSRSKSDRKLSVLISVCASLTRRFPSATSISRCSESMMNSERSIFSRAGATSLARSVSSNWSRSVRMERRTWFLMESTASASAPSAAAAASVAPASVSASKSDGSCGSSYASTLVASCIDVTGGGAGAVELRAPQLLTTRAPSAPAETMSPPLAPNAALFCPPPAMLPCNESAPTGSLACVLPGADHERVLFQRRTKPSDVTVMIMSPSLETKRLPSALWKPAISAFAWSARPDGPGHPCRSAGSVKRLSRLSAPSATRVSGARSAPRGSTSMLNSGVSTRVMRMGRSIEESLSEPGGVAKLPVGPSMLTSVLSITETSTSPSPPSGPRAAHATDAMRSLIGK
mmetsp:Transcript_26632/g.87321  ORF Transcript_26632/g.87321 Transcript_26632/m.87321 type:complete len:453 (-) Transcript_26632:1460-2818(-)